MTSQRLFKVLGSSAVILSLLSSCDNGCQQDRESFVHLSFTSTSGRVLNRLNYLIFSDVSNMAIQASSDLTSSFDDVEIDLDPHGQQAMVVLTLTYTDYGDSFTVKDTLLVNYTTSPEFLDMSCGCTMKYRIDTVEPLSSNLLSNVSLTDPAVTPDSNTNIAFEY